MFLHRTGFLDSDLPVQDVLYGGQVQIFWRNLLPASSKFQLHISGFSKMLILTIKL